MSKKNSRSSMSNLTTASLASLVQHKSLKLLASFGGADSLASKLSSNARTGFAGDFEEQRKKFGRNYVAPPREQYYVELLFQALKDSTIIMLMVAAVVSLIIGLAVEKNLEHGWIEGVSILISVLVVINVQSMTDYSKAREFRRQQLELENKQVSHVIREGKSLEVSPRELVVGDIVRFQVGDIIAVDCVLLESNDVKMDESALTGETKLVSKSVYHMVSTEEGEETEGFASEDKTDPFLVSGTNVMSGSGLALAVAVGENSVQGSILAAVGRTDDSKVKSSPTDKKATSSKSKAKAKDILEGNGAMNKFSEKDLENQVMVEPDMVLAKTESDESFPELEDDKLGNEGGTLAEKLDNFALLIGKFGFTIAMFALLVMIIKFVVMNFALNGRCEDYNSELACVEENTFQVDHDICDWKASENDCARVWNSAHDLEALLGFFVTAITILVVVIPEGLPLAVTLSLAVSMRRMMKDNNQVKYMDACETMGSATTICSDKTGTLTINKMTVVRLGLPVVVNKETLILKEFAKPNDSTESLSQLILKDFENPVGANETDGETNISESLNLLCYNAILNSAATSNVIPKAYSESKRGDPLNEVDKYKYQGNATECALLKLSLELNFNVSNIRSHEIFIDPTGVLSDWGTLLFPFSSERKRMSIVIPLKEGSENSNVAKYRLFSKGAPNHILNSCTKIFVPGPVAPTQLSDSLFNKDGEVRNQRVNGDEVFDLSDQMRAEIDEKIISFQQNGLRAIALAFKDIFEEPTGGWKNLVKQEKDEISAIQNEMEEELIFIGIVGIEDPLRPEIIDSIKKCNTAGVDVRMCTGDALDTAISIAIKAGLLQPRHLEEGSVNVPKPNFAMTGTEFIERVVRLDTTKPKSIRKVFDFATRQVVEKLAYPYLTTSTGERVVDQAKLDEIWPKLRVLARCQPQDKLVLVTGLRNSKVYLDKARCEKLKRDFGIEIFHDRQVVAVTGDGTNDAPALKRADVGFAMGITGTETAKQAADILLLNDNFASIVQAVKWGRNVFQSISKFIQFQLTVNVSAVFLAVLGAVVLNESPLQPVQMLWVNLIMDSLASLALATDPPSEYLLERKPYGRKRRILSQVMIVNIIGQACYQIGALLIVLFKPELLPGNPIPDYEFKDSALADDGFGSVHWTIFFNAFVQMQLFNELNSRKLQDVARLRKNPSEWNVFENIQNNHIFIAILVTTFVLQILIVQFGEAAFKLSQDGISFNQWVLCVLLGAGGLVWQVIVVNPFLYFFGSEDEAFIKSPATPHGHGTELTKENAKSKSYASSNATKQRFERLKKHLRYGFLFGRTIDNNELSQDAGRCWELSVFTRGESRPNYEYGLTKHDSLRLEKLVQSKGKSLMNLPIIKEEGNEDLPEGDEDENNEKDKKPTTV